jgi:hypothetical protein
MAGSVCRGMRWKYYCGIRTALFFAAIHDEVELYAKIATVQVDESSKSKRNVAMNAAA